MPSPETAERVRAEAARILAQNRRTGHAAWNDRGSQQAVTREPFIQPQYFFAKPHGMRIGEGKSGIGQNGADIGDMVIKPFEFLQHHA